MSSNRLSYDSCAYQKSLQESMSPLDYMLYTGKYDNCAKCRIEFGVVGGNNVSLFSGNLVDLESELRGQTRQASLCPTNESIFLTNPKLMNQPSCNIQYYPKTPTQQPSKVSGCSFPQNNMKVIEKFNTETDTKKNVNIDSLLSGAYMKENKHS